MSDLDLPRICDYDSAVTERCTRRAVVTTKAQNSNLEEI